MRRRAPPYRRTVVAAVVAVLIPGPLGPRTRLLLAVCAITAGVLALAVLAHHLH